MSDQNSERCAIPERPTLREPADRICLLVLGMHRSGTSALAGVLAHLGAHLPKTLLPANADNPRGYWESQVLMDFNDRLLASAGSNWYDFEHFDPVSPVAESFATEFKALIDAEFGNLRLLVLKDPRICRLLPFWLERLSALKVTPRVVITLRNPLEVAASLNLRNGLSITTSLLLWLRHTLDAEAATRSLVRTFVPYEDLLMDWHAVSERLERDLGLRWPKRWGEVALGIEEFLSRSLRHHQFTQEQLLARKDVVDWVKTVYPILNDMGQSGTAGASAAERLDQVRREFNRACQVFGALVSEKA